MKLRTLSCILVAGGLLQACVPLVVAGVGTGVASTMDRRAYSEQLMDTEIEHKFNRGFPATLEAKTNVSATAYHRWVLLTGQAIDEASRAEVEAHARSVPNVLEVYNEVSIGYPASFTARSNDAWLTSSVKTRLVNAKELSANNVKVVSESGTVYLMGLLTETEANVAAQVARSTSGVRKVVNVIEVISPEKARQLSVQPSQPAAPAQ